VCIGKTFAETAFKVVLPLILKAFNNDGKFGEFMDESHYKQKPELTSVIANRPKILVKIQ